jgi:lysophospholipase L1-like esterase
MINISQLEITNCHFMKSELHIKRSYSRRFGPLILLTILSFSGILYAQDPGRFQNEIDIIDLKNIEKLNTHDLILFTGSSSIRRWQDIPDYFPGKNIINTGFGGSQMSDLLYYADSVIIKYKPVQVFIYEGDNDIAAGKKTDDVKKEAENLLLRIRKKLPHSQIVFISVKPSVSRWKLKDEYIKLNAAFKKLSRENKNIKFIDVWTPLLNDKGLPKKEVFIADSLHINKLGYEVWVKKIKKVIK